MPKFLFYLGTAFCLFLALCSAAVVFEQLQRTDVTFVAAGTLAPSRAALAVVVALFAGVCAAAIFLRMAALVAARNLFAGFVSVLAIAGSMASLVWTLMLQTRMLILTRSGAATTTVHSLAEMHLAALLMFGFFLSLALVALRPYFRVQASRMLSALVVFPLPLILLIIVQELFVTTSNAPLPATSPALVVFYAVLSILFFAISVHSVRHRYLFLEMTNLRELLDSRATGGAGARIGGVAFDS
jgi:hypothetical protein